MTNWLYRDIDNETVFGCSYDLTSFDTAERWQAVLSGMGMTYYGRDDRGGFIWSADDIDVVTYNNPLTGEYNKAGDRYKEIGYASYIGVCGQFEAVQLFKKLVSRHAVYVKGHAPDTRGYA